MNFWQWLYDLIAVLTLPFYLSALVGLLEKPTNIRKGCLACSIYVVDTVIVIAYTLYFVYFWFSNNDVAVVSQTASKIANSGLENTAQSANAAKIVNGVTDLSQSASPSRELFLTISGTVITTALRIYFCFVFVSFTKQLLLQAARTKRNYRTDSVSEEANYPPTIVGKAKRFVYGLEVRSKEFLEEYLLGQR